jgi:hypothetical protein
MVSLGRVPGMPAAVQQQIVDSGRSLILAVGCVQVLLAFLGIAAGGLLALRRGTVGKVLAAVFWAITVVIVLLAVAGAGLSAIS